MNRPAPAGGRRTQARGDRARSAIIEAVRELLAEMPIAEVTTSQITERAGIDRSVFYFYFPTKYAALDAALARMIEQMQQAAFPDRAADESTHSYFTRMLFGAAAVNAEYTPVIKAAIEVRSLDDRLADRLADMVDHFVRRLTALVEEESARNGRTPVADVPATVRLLFAMTGLGAQHIDLVVADAEPAQYLSRLVDIWIHALWGTDPGERG